ncbi:PH domain-containing protein [Ligilactobacillus sp. WILCCON 0076]|uniref:PH domain-containing protein n=1 Tax=Ligilactobacillus ubinensis TaxID=2876789 RepID=A0A9X2JN35_9LACO|nr:PH domain-containing protein [Ligilactobacillus ubinensis]MCP0887970.1 PH domain-containing protein [Ligilactobacillus ubinensis]
MSSFYRLHPLMILQQSFITAKKQATIYFLTVTLFLVHKYFYAILLFCGVTFWCLGNAFYQWLFFKYRFEQDQLVIKKGLFIKKQLIVPYNRIQSLQRQVWFVFKPLGIISLIIETAGTTAENVKLLAVKEIVYDHLTALRQGERDQTLATKPHPFGPQFEVTTRDIWRFSLTDQSVFMMLIAWVFFFDSLKGWLPKKLLESRLEILILSGFISLLFGVLLLVGLVILATLFKNYVCYYHFKVWRQNDDLFIERGLFTRSTLTIPLHRIQAIQIKQNFFRVWLKLASVELILAAGKGNENDDTVDDDTFYLLPIIAQPQVLATLQHLLPEWHLTEAKLENLNQGPRWLFLRFSFLFAAVMFITGFWLNLYLGIAAAVLGLLLIWRTWWSSYHQAAGMIGNQLLYLKKVSGFNLKTLITPQNKVQCQKIRTTWWLKTKQLGHFSWQIKKGLGMEKVQLKYLSLEDCKALRKLATIIGYR